MFSLPALLAALSAAGVSEQHLVSVVDCFEAERALFLEALEHLPVGLVLAKAPSGELVFGNRQVERILRHPFRWSATIEDYGQWTGFHPETGLPYEPYEWPLARALRLGETVRDEVIGYERGDHTIAYIKVSAAPLYQQSLIGAVVIFEDITESREEHEQLRLYTERLRVLAGVGPTINSELTLPAIMNRLVASAMRLTSSAAGMYGMVEHECVVFTEYREGDDVRPIRYSFPPGFGAPGRVLETKRSYVCNDAGADPYVVTEIRRALKFDNFLTVPIVDSFGGVLGCFEVLNKPTRFDTRDVWIVESLAASAAVAIRNARSLEQVQQARATLLQAQSDLERRMEGRMQELAHENQHLRQKIAALQQGDDLSPSP